nr:SOS response-associated peptidase family protein [Sphingomonas sp. GM_Shp_2]
MCNRARMAGEPETLVEHFSADWLVEKPRDNRFNPRELFPKSRAYVVRAAGGQRGLDVMEWDVTAGQAPWPMTNVRNLKLPQWKALAEQPEHRCLIPLTEFCEWTPEKHAVDSEKPIKGEMWFKVTDQPVTAIAGFWREIAGTRYFAMVTCDPNPLVAPIHPKAMITILAPEDHDRWMTGSYQDVLDLQRPYPADQMEVRGPVFPTRKPQVSTPIGQD